MADSKEVERNLWTEVDPSEDFTRFEGHDRSSVNEIFEPASEHCSAWTDPPKPNPYYASFGDQGVTASVNAYGNLMQFGRYLGPDVGRSGMFSADRDDIYEPVVVIGRAMKLQEICDDQATKYGLVFESPEMKPDKRPELKFVRDRWPRFEFNKKDFKVTIQWMVHGDTVLQQYVVTNGGDEKTDFSFSFHEAMLIRDLEYLDIRYNFNESKADDSTYKTLNGPQDYARVRVHEFSENDKKGIKNQLDRMFEDYGGPTTENDDSGTESDNGGTENDKGGTNTSIKAPNVKSSAVAVVAAIFVNGKTMQWNKKMVWPWKLEGRTPQRETTSLEVVTAYKMIPLPELTIGWENFLIPADSANVNKFLREEEEKTPFTTFSLSGIDISTSEPIDVEKSRIPAAPNPLGTPKESSAAHLEFLLRRHLEHILSVCAIPLRQPLLVDEKSEEFSTEHPVPVALTCGDISAHRVCTSASFFAFRFLIDVAKRLDRIESNCYIRNLRERIDVVCRGHLVWLFDTTGRLEAVEYFAANYWVTGAIMPFGGASSWMPENSLTDTAFQFIKAAEFASLYPGTDGLEPMGKSGRERIQTKIEAVYNCWIKDLQNRDRRRSFAWPHHRADEVNVFRLDDQVWIWKALKSVEDLSASKQSGFNVYQPITPSAVQRDTLGHFTTLNDVSGKRMLAVTRSSRDTRFLFHARDTVLFYGIDWGLKLDDTSFQDVWNDTLEAQIHHDENQETGWENSLRYALAIVMGSRGKSINKRSPEKLIESSLTVLIESTSPNGFFPGLLNQSTKEPELFTEEEERDFYFHTSFEIPFVLLRYATDINKIYEEKPVPLDKAQQVVEHAMEASHLKEYQDNSDNSMTQPKHQERGSSVSDAIAVLLEFGELLNAKTAKAARKAAAMKKNMPFNTLINQSNIIDVGEEWLYNYPSFLRDERVKFKDAEKQISSLAEERVDSIIVKAAKEFMIAPREIKRANDALKKAIKERERALDERAKAATERDNAGDAPYHTHNKLTRAYSKADEACNKASDKVSDAWGIAKAISDKLSRASDTGFTNDDALVTVVNTPKKNITKNNADIVPHKKRKYEGIRGVDYDGNSDLWKAFSEPRKAENAKKRLIWVKTPNDETALVCYLASHEEEKPPTREFFDRHASFDKWFFDDTNMAENTWTSELHLSFYQLLKTEDQGLNIKDMLQPREPSFPGKLKGNFTRASMGFRFYGDFFDRYWTCHFIESIPAGNPDYPDWLDNSEGDRSWGQRTVLELYFVHRILTEIVKSALAIFEEVKTNLSISGTLDPGFLFLSLPSSDEYFYSSRQWETAQHILRTVEADLSIVLENISKWEMREKDRGQERPRWTRKDESKYGRKISKLSMLTRGNIGELKNCCASIKSLKETVDATQDKKRDDLGLRGSENIRIFTYVTVVFLPIGFAASVFSLDHSSAVHLVICAAVALAITVVALFNAQTFNRLFERAGKTVDRYYTWNMGGSYLKQLHEKHEELRDSSSSTAKVSSLSQDSIEKQPEPPLVGGPWHLWFWLAYVLIEVPARRVLLAYYAIKSHKFSRSVFLCVVTGVILLPVFVVSWLVQLFVYNVFDSVRVVWGWLVSLFSISLPNKTPPDSEFPISHFAFPLEQYRPLKKLLCNKAESQPLVPVEHEDRGYDTSGEGKPADERV